MRLLANPLSIIGKKAKRVDLDMDSVDAETTISDNSSTKLTSGFIASEPEARFNPKKWAKSLGWTFAAIGVACLFFSMLYLPFLLVSPTNFCFFLSCGILCSFSGMYLLKGNHYTKEMFFTGPQKYYSYALIPINTIALVASLRQISAILCLVLGVVQFIALTYVLLVRLPYGKQFLDSFYRAVGGCFRGLFQKLITRRFN